MLDTTTNTNQPPSLTPVQEKVSESLAFGSTLTGAAEEFGLHRVTIYRWLKTIPAFGDAVRRNRAEFALSRRDDLHYLANRAVETLLAILDNPRASPAVHLRTSMFIIQQNQKAGQNWHLPEPVPGLDDDNLTDPVLISEEVEKATESAAGATECITMQQEQQDPEDVAGQQDDPPQACEAPYRHGILPSCPVPDEILNRRDFRLHIENAMDDLRTIKHEEYRAEKDDPEAA